MTSVAPVTSTPTTSTATQSKGALTSDFQTFLKMLTVQMQNQDPLNPIESSDYAVQLATFSGVEQQVQTNTLLQALAAQLGVAGMAEMAGWVGMEARVAAPARFDGAPITLAPNPAVGADQAVLVAYDASGAEVTRQTIAASAETLDWAGTDANGAPLPAGNYSFRLESYNNGTLISTDTVEVYSRIVEAQGTGNGTMLVLEGGATVAASDVTALREAGRS
ncbi:flagellar hook assembly protein FlgD [Sedimentimonas flavescens]|uniref:Basal-body rod modification protein FlgD n=1 Tax=Sedimentimonas flavescens TaxID=2851012 RepID=A0ABT2ZYM7_9RHOB|nr:flagellar hook capping FlgD N-terminal domain-containing protein [Sedimentimonas flavescens]MCV2878847.1 flagellar hook assembly protein FlgD [Sedimentimonas flavescens]